MNLFYTRPEDVRRDFISIRDQEVKHAVKVMRLQSGDEIDVTDGAGNLYHCKISSIGKKSADLRVLDSKNELPGSPQITLCFGIIKKRDRLEFAVEKAVELGVNRIMIFRGDHSEKQNVRLDRIENTILSAVKQSLRYYLPAVRFEGSLQSALDKAYPDTTIVVADQETSTQNIRKSTDNYFLVVGPEGGFSADERRLLESFNAVSYSLGSKRLRTETAAITMVDRFRAEK